MELHDDDKPVGRVLSRREVLGLLGGAGAAMLVGTGFTQFGLNKFALTPTPSPSSTPLPACVVRPELTEGPYFVDEMLNRSDIRSDPTTGDVKDGALLNLMFRVSDVSTGTCVPLEGAQVDVWHCDADGVYSDVTDGGFNTVGQQFLRGYQVTDKDGVAQFITIYPGWYSGRAVHIHFKIRTDPASDSGYEFTSQFFFDDELSDEVQSKAPYVKGEHNVRNEDDSIFQQSDGLMTLEVTETDDGYSAVFDIALDLSDEAVGASDSAGGGGGQGGGPGGNGGGPGGAPPSGTRPAGGPGGRPTATPTPGA